MHLHAGHPANGIHTMQATHVFLLSALMLHCMLQKTISGCHLDQRGCLVLQLVVNRYPLSKEGAVNNSSTSMNFVHALRSIGSSLATVTHTWTELSPERPMVQLNHVTPMLRVPMGSQNGRRHCWSQVWWSIRMHTLQHTVASVMHVVAHGCMTLHKDVCTGG